MSGEEKTRYCPMHRKGKGAYLPVSKFYGPTGPYCKKCMKEYARARYRAEKSASEIPPPESGRPWVDTDTGMMAIKKHNRIMWHTNDRHFREIKKLQARIESLEENLKVARDRLSKKPVEYAS